MGTSIRVTQTHAACIFIMFCSTTILCTLFINYQDYKPVFLINFACKHTRCLFSSNKGVIPHPGSWDCLVINFIFIKKMNAAVLTVTFLYVYTNINNDGISCGPPECITQSQPAHSRMTHTKSICTNSQSLRVAQMESRIFGVINLSSEQSLRFTVTIYSRHHSQHAAVCQQQEWGPPNQTLDELKGNTVGERQRSCTGWN